MASIFWDWTSSCLRSEMSRTRMICMCRRLTVVSVTATSMGMILPSIGQERTEFTISQSLTATAGSAGVISSKTAASDAKNKVWSSADLPTISSALREKMRSAAGLTELMRARRIYDDHANHHGVENGSQAFFGFFLRDGDVLA